MGKHDPDRDGNVHPDTAAGLDPKAFAEAGKLDDVEEPDDDGDDG